MSEFTSKANCLRIDRPIYVYWTSPCDIWDGAIKVEGVEALLIEEMMPEWPRGDGVYKSFLPGNGSSLEVFYFCKADNNGTTYIFSNCDISVKGKGLDEWEFCCIKEITIKEVKE